MEEVRTLTTGIASNVGPSAMLPDAAMEAHSLDGVALRETEGLSPQWVADQLAASAGWVNSDRLCPCINTRATPSLLGCLISLEPAFLGSWWSTEASLLQPLVAEMFR